VTKVLTSCLAWLWFLFASGQEGTMPVAAAFVWQEEHAGDGLDFIRYLLSRGDNNEALFLLEELPGSTPERNDSVAFLKGWALYGQKILGPSAAALLDVSEKSPLYIRSRFFAAYNLAHTGDIRRARGIVAAMNGLPEGMEPAMKNFQLGGMALLARDYDAFTTHAASFSGRYHAFATQEARLQVHHQSLLALPARSPLVAGVLSAAVPGLGKIYAGKTGEGIAAFIYTMAFGFTAYDFYRGAGPQSALFIVSAGIASVFYAGNIWGSAVAVNRKKYERNHELDQRILFDLHIPLRNAFN